MNNQFEDLMRRAEQLTADMDDGNNLPRVERNLHQLAEAGQRLWSKTAALQGDECDVRASLLLSSKGLQLPKLSQRLEFLNTARSFESLEPVAEKDIQGFLKNEKENAILSVIETSKTHAFADADKTFLLSILNEWEMEKQKVLSSLLCAGKEAMTFPSETEIINDYGTGKGRSTMTTMEMAFAKQVYMCNEKTIQGDQCSYLDALYDVAAKSDDYNAFEIWDLLKQMISNLPILENDPFKVRYLQYVEKVVYGNIHQAKLGGIPGTLNLVRSFLKIKMPHSLPGLEDGKVDGVPVWALMYYCLRCGDAAATIQSAEGLPPLCFDFKEILKEYFRNDEYRLQPSTESKIRLQYKRSIHTSTDPFKRILFAIIGCCDTDNIHPEVASKSDDYIWLKLQQITFSENEDAERISLPKLQSLLLEEYGISHFKAYEHPLLFTRMLFLTGQFEAGIEFLSTIEKFRSHAVHFAIAIEDAGLLIKSDNLHSPLLSAKMLGNKTIQRLNFARLLMTYTRKFQTTDPRESLENMEGPNNENIFASCVSDLVMETREYEMLLGHLNSDGSRKPGCIEKFQLDTSMIIKQVAQTSEVKGQFEDAAALYDLSGCHEKVLEILNRRLSQVVSLSCGPNSARERLACVARTIAERYKTYGHNGSKTKSSTFYLLLDLMYFFDLYHSSQHKQALDVIKQIKLLPHSINDVEQKITAFRQCSDEVKQCLPDVLLAVMNVLHYIYDKDSAKMEEKPFKKESEHQKILCDIREEAKSLVTFAGLLPYQLPGDTNARLIRMEILMN
eukprot:gene18802-20696_t